MRHNGFIPWDDDLDICMLRKDYNKFIKVADKEFRKSKWFSLITIHNEPEYDKLFARVVNGRSINFDKEYLDRFHGFPFSVGIDIFPLDYISRDKDEEERRCELVKKINDEINNIVNIYNSDVDEVGLMNIDFRLKLINNCIDNVEKMCDVKVDRKENVINQLYLLEESIISQYSAEYSDEIAFMTIWLENRGNRFKKEYYKYSEEIDFENIRIKIPVMYDAILKENYGDYLKLVHNGSCHNYPIYKDQIEFLREKTGIEFPKYVFKHDDLIKNRIYDEEMNMDRYLVSQVRSSVKILKEAHMEIIKHRTEINVVLDILAQCQDMAIMLGNTIEESKGEKFEGVHYIEEYCETVYHEYEKVNEQQAKDVAEYYISIGLLNQIINKAEKSIMDMMDIRESVLFIVNKADSWKYFEHLWK